MQPNGECFGSVALVDFAFRVAFVLWFPLYLRACNTQLQCCLWMVSELSRTQGLCAKTESNCCVTGAFLGWDRIVRFLADSSQVSTNNFSIRSQ